MADRIMEFAANELIEKAYTDVFEQEEDIQKNDGDEELSSMDKEEEIMRNDSQNERGYKEFGKLNKNSNDNQLLMHQREVTSQIVRSHQILS